MKLHVLTVAAAVLAVLNLGCSPEQMAKFESDLQQNQLKVDSRQRACATEADRSWNLYSGSAKTAYEKSLGSGMYEIKVTAPNHSGVCTVTEAGMVRGIMNDGGGNYNAQPSGSSYAPSSAGSEYDRGCADARSGSYDRSGNAGQTYENGWNACHSGGGNQSGAQQQNGDRNAREYDRGCADAKAGSYDRSGNAGQAYEQGWNACH